MLDGVMLLWFVLTALSVLFVAIDIRTTPESPVMKWGFVLVTAYTGPIGAFMYALGCREPLPGLHERYVSASWRQALGSTMHCVAGDGVGILIGAVIASVLGLSRLADIALEYVLGFAFGLMIFQALFMRDMAGGSYVRALKTSFMPELLSMNCLMGGMVAVMTVAMMRTPGGHEPTHAAFWFIMSMALLVGAIVAYPMNAWLVSNHLKHGMTTVRPPGSAFAQAADASMGMAKKTPVAMAGAPIDQAVMGNGSTDHAAMSHAATGRGSMNHAGMAMGATVPPGRIATMTVLSFAVFALGLGVGALFGGLR